MALGKRHSNDFLPIIKYDARNGTLQLQDKTNENGTWKTTNRDVSEKFRAIADLECIQVGWINFPVGGAPEFKMVPVGEDPGDRPTRDYKEGFRLFLKLDQEIGGDVREFLSTAAAAWDGISTLHDAYLTQASKHPGDLPIVQLVDVLELPAANGKAAYQPSFEIIGWAPRPKDLRKTLATAANNVTPANLPARNTLADDEFV